VERNTIAQIDHGVLVLLGVATTDTDRDALYLADKIVNLRIFEDEAGKLNRSLLDQGGSMLVVSQFTLLGECRKGRRPSFTAAAEPHKAQQLYLTFVEQVRTAGIITQTGQFRATMQVSLVNDGPVTLLVES
jgi:D-tyrosyl-tRNA(Tyr) deacylase